MTFFHQKYGTLNHFSSVLYTGIFCQFINLFPYSMNREEIYQQCVHKIDKTNCLLLQLPTGFGKTALSIHLVNHVLSQKNYRQASSISILILVAKRVHKQTWTEEIQKWGGFHHSSARITTYMECYESLYKHQREAFTIILADEIHHLGSEKRMSIFKNVLSDKIIGLSATIPQQVSQFFRYNYHSETITSSLSEAIDAEVLPTPTILLFPLQVENSRMSETIELNPKAKGPIYYGEYRDYWKYKKAKNHAILRCTQQQKLLELNKLIEWYKKKTMQSSNPALRQTWLYFCGKRLEFFADCKLQWVKLILHHLAKERTITFCKTIAQAEQLGKNCIHSQNKDSTAVYDSFNKKKINHITTVNILNENANLVDCKYAVFANLSSSEICMPQRLGRSLRHKSPVIIIPYYKDTREEEILEKYIEGFDKNYIKTIQSISEI